MGQESYTCPKCGMTSYHPDDIKYEYCGNCHKTKRELEAEAYFLKRAPGRWGRIWSKVFGWRS